MKKIYVIVGFLILSSSLAAEDISLSYRGGVYHTPVTLNGSVRLEFVVDTGAASVLIPNDVFKTLLRTRTISEDDILGVGKSETATGEIVDTIIINLRGLEIGSQTITNVEASVGGDNASLLLGQSALKKLEPWSLNTSKQILTIKSNSIGIYAPEYHFDTNTITKAEILTFIDKYISRGNSRDLKGVLSLYGDRVDYFRKDNASNNFIYNDKVKYYKRWPSSQAEFVKIRNIENITNDEGTKKVTYVMKFDVYNYAKQKGIKGQAVNTVILKKENGTIQIISDKQKVLSRNKY